MHSSLLLREQTIAAISRSRSMVDDSADGCISDVTSMSFSKSLSFEPFAPIVLFNVEFAFDLFSVLLSWFVARDAAKRFLSTVNCYLEKIYI